MSLVASLNVGVSALRSFSEGIQVISNNIANVSTVAYKSSHANYSDTFSNLLRPLVPGETGIGAAVDPTQIGGGVQVQSVTASFTQGTVSNTGDNADLAIAGPGYFRVKDPVSKREYVTRAGNFRFDANGFLVTQQGYRVQGTAGAKTKLAYNPATGDFDAKTASSNPVTVSATRASVDPNVLQGVDTSKLSVGMVLYSSSPLAPFGATVTKGADTVTVQLSDADAKKLVPGMPFSGNGIPAGTYIKSVTGTTLTLSQVAATSNDPTSDVYAVPSWTVGKTSSLANNHAVITKISGSTVTLSNMDGINVYNRPLDFTFMTPRTVKLTATNLTPQLIPVGTTTTPTLPVSAATAINPTPTTTTTVGANNLVGYVTGSYDATISIGDAANLKVGMTINTGGGQFDGATITGFKSTSSASTKTISFSKPATADYVATDTVKLTTESAAVAIAGVTWVGVSFTAQNLALTGVTAGLNTATVADAANLKVGMTVRTDGFATGTRITKIVGTTLTFSANATSTLAADAITAVSSLTDTSTGVSVTNRVYAVDVQDSSAVVDGMVAKITDPLTQNVSYAGVTVDKSSPVPRVLLDFGAFGSSADLDANLTAGSEVGENPDPLTSNFIGSFGIDFETNNAAANYSSASRIGDVRISFDQKADFDLTDINGNGLGKAWLPKAQNDAPKVKNFTIGTDGSIMATLSNGQTFTTGKVLMQDFLDAGALIREGNNLFSGMELAGEKNTTRWNNLTVDNIDQVTAGKSGLGAIQGSALELSNVDIGEEFAQMITTQRSFQAGSRVITVSDQMLEEVVNLKR